MSACLWISAALLTLTFVTPVDAASTAPRPGNAAGFEIDTGDQTLFSGDGTSAGFTVPPGGDDWAQGASATGVLGNDGSPNVPFTILYVDQNWGNSSPSGGSDATQFSGTSNKNPDLIGAGQSPWSWDGTGGGPQKNDLTNVYVHLRASGECQWVIFAAETRSDDGDSHVDFEYNQAGILQTGAIAGLLIGQGPAGGRTDGDFVASVDLENGGVAVLPSFRIWDAATNMWLLQDLDSAPCADAVFVTANDMNITHSAATAPWHHYEGDGGISPTGTILTYQLVEIAVNITAFGLDVDLCNNNTTVLAKTRSSQSFTAELKDFALFRPFQGSVPDVEIVGEPIICPGGEAIYSATVTMPDEGELVSFLLGDGERQREFDVNLDGAVTVSDLAALVVPKPEDLRVRRGLKNAVTMIYEWTITGDATFCGGGTTAVGASVCVQADVVCDGGFVLTVLVNADPCTDEASLAVGVIDENPPEITCPADVTYECDEMGDPGEATGTDDCGPVEISFVDEIIEGSCPQEYTVARTWTATDVCENTASCVQLISYVDTTPPEIECPPGFTVECIGDVPLCDPFDAIATDNCDPEVDITCSQGPLVGGPCGGTVTNTYTATDDCGNSSSCTQVITVIDTTPPEISCPPDATYECDAVPGDLGSATAIDNCDPEVEITLDESEEGICPTVITRTFTATDDCGNSSSCTQIVEIVDTTAPEITCPPDATYECDAVPGDFGVATATDNCDPAPTVSLTGTAEFDICPTILQLTWTAVDECGNQSSCVQTITIEDTTPPVVTCPPDATFDCDQMVEIEEATATDNCDPSPVLVMTMSDVEGDCADEQIITVTWTATDVCGNSATCEQIIRIVDETPPVFPDCPPDATFECDESPDLPIPTAEDACDPDPEVIVEETLDDSDPCEVLLVRRFTAFDNCGNLATCEQVVTFVDTTPPLIACPPDLTLECDEEFIPVLPEAVDNCTPVTVGFLSSAELPGGDPCLRTISYIWQASDLCSNVATCEQLVTIVDTTPPEIACPPDVTVECDESTEPSNTGEATATDNCNDFAVTWSDVAVGDPCLTIITRTWRAEDACGNESTCDQIITVVDRTPPDITCPPDVTIDCLDEPSPALTGEARATDECNEVAIEFSDSVTGDTCETVIERVWTATDACGNSSACVQIIRLVDTTPPDITCPPDLTVECDEPIDGGMATATDDCSSFIIELEESVDDADPCNVVITRTWTATDNCGNSASCVQTITIVDTTAPVIECPGDLLIDCDTPVTIVGLVLDNCDPSPEATCTVIDAQVPDAYTFEPLGDGSYRVILPVTNTIIVSCVATDRCGNTSTPCTFEVTAVCRSFEGCTPGYWKQPHHFDSWVPTGYTPDTLFCDVFGLNASGESVECAFPGLTLLEVLSLQGSADPGPNQLNNLGRHTVAALLNSAAPDVEYDLTTEEVINLFNETYPQAEPNNYNPLHYLFATLNELGCPLN